MRSINKVMIIGNLTRDVELRHTKEGTAVATFGLATNRNWTQETGEKREETDFHRIVAWGKLAELCEKFMLRGAFIPTLGLIMRDCKKQLQKSTFRIW